MLNKKIASLINNKGFIDLSSLQLIETNSKGEYVQPYFLADGEKYYFKPNLVDTLNCYGEIVSGYFLNEYKVKNLKYYLATYKGKIGTISRDFKKEGEKEVSGKAFLNEHNLKENSLENLEKALNIEYKQGKITKQERDMYLMHNCLVLIADSFNNNCDRLKTNWGHLKGNNTVRPIACFDSELAFNFIYDETKLEKLVNLDEEAKEKAFKYFDTKQTPEFLATNKTSFTKNSRSYITNLKNLPKKYSKLLNSRLEILKNININNFIEFIESDYNAFVKKHNPNAEFKLPNLVKEVVKNGFEVRQKTIVKAFNLEKTNNLEL